MASELSILTEGHPNDWEIRKIKYVFDERRETNDPVKTDVLISLTHDRGVIPHSEKGDIGNKEKDDLTKYKLVYPGDIVVNSMNVIIGSAGLSNYYGLVSPVYYMLRAKDPEADKKFFHYLFRSVLFQKSLVGVGSGILEHRMRISMDKLGSHFIPVPPVDEQRLISRYLDKKTQQIDTLIEKIEKKIELLKEQRTSLINHYVTKGLDPNVEMKDSGVEWIGKIPKHWIKTPLKHLFEYKKGGRAQLLTQEYILSNPGPYPVFSGSTLSDGIGAISDFDFDYEAVIHVSTVGAAMTSQIVRGRFSLSQNCLILIPKDQISIEFLLWVIQLNFSELRKQLPKIIQPSFRYEDLDQISVYIPTSTEQLSIVEAIKNKVEFLDTLGMKESLRISLLEEYRQSLISSVVTGKVRVTEDMV